MTKYCEYPNCRKRALYGMSRSCPLRCRIHRIKNMQLVSSLCECGLGNPLFNYEDEIVAVCCALCKNDSMINIVIKQCTGYVKDDILLKCPYDNIGIPKYKNQCAQCFSHNLI